MKQYHRHIHGIGIRQCISQLDIYPFTSFISLERKLQPKSWFQETSLSCISQNAPQIKVNNTGSIPVLYSTYSCLEQVRTKKCAFKKPFIKAVMKWNDTYHSRMNQFLCQNKNRRNLLDKTTYEPLHAWQTGLASWSSQGHLFSLPTSNIYRQCPARNISHQQATFSSTADKGHSHKSLLDTC